MLRPLTCLAAQFLTMMILGHVARAADPERLILGHRMIGFGPSFAIDKRGPYAFLFPVKDPQGPDISGWCREGHIGALHAPFADQVEQFKWEIGQAQEAGLDGFVLDICGGTHEFGIPNRLIQAAEELGGTFKIGLCLDFAGGDQAGKLVCVKEWMKLHQDSPAQLRLKGQPAFITYGSGSLGRKPEATKALFDELRAAAGQPIYLQVDLTELPNVKPEECEARVRAFAACADGVTCFFSRQNFERNAQAFATAARVCHELGKDWCLSLWGNYYSAGRKANMENIGADNSRLWDAMWRLARETQADQVQLVTWNDITEDTTIMPGLRRHFAFVDLLADYYGPWYRTGVEPTPQRDQVWVFYRPYRTDAAPALVTGPRARGSATQDFVEVRSLLVRPGRVAVAGMGEQDVPAGMSSVEFPSRPGPVKVSLSRTTEKGTQTKLEFQAPEWITDRPWRQDFALRAFSNREPEHWAKWFPNQPPSYVCEYGDDDGNGLPNWFEHYYFGQWTGVDPAADPDHDGRTNREELLDRTDPRNPPAVYPAGFTWDAERDFRPNDETCPIPDALGAQVWDFEFFSIRERPGKFVPAGLLVRQIPAWLEWGGSWSFGIGKPNAGALSFFGEADSASALLWTSPLNGKVKLTLKAVSQADQNLVLQLERLTPNESLWKCETEPKAEAEFSSELSVTRGERLRLSVAGQTGKPRWQAQIAWSLTKLTAE